MKIKCWNIKWDVDYDKDFKRLPQEMVIEVDEKDYKDDPDTCVADALSDEVGFCHDGFEMEEI